MNSQNNDNQRVAASKKVKEKHSSPKQSNFKKHKGKSFVIVLYAFIILFTAISLLFVQRGTEKMIEFANSSVPEEIDQFSKGYIEYFQNGQTDEIFSLLDPKLQTEDAQNQIKSAQQYLEFTNEQMELVGLKMKTINKSGGVAEFYYHLTYEIQNQDPDNPQYDQMMFALDLVEVNEKIIVGSFFVRTTEFSSRDIVLENVKDNWVIIIVFFIIHLFVLYTLIQYLRQAKEPNWKWLLLVLLLTLSIKTSRGAFGINLGFSLDYLDPSSFAIPIPLGAIIFYFKRSKILK